ncbi:hypothetical protein [Alteromonas gracilis]|uniref:hypothetical protein n=1 Tax=Alteromonas gracilis TaxID=1479524 RepID=UPI002FE12C2F
MKLFKKTALAVALTAAASSSAFAADLAFNSDQTVVLADVIFGNGKPGTGSEETLITAPSVTFSLMNDAQGNAIAGATGDLFPDVASFATVKFTLGGGAVFGEDLSTTTLVNNANGGDGNPGTGAFSVVADADVTYQVVQGGAIGDNTITFQFTTTTPGDAIESMTFEGYAVKNLTPALNPDSDDKIVELGVEYVEAINSDDTNDAGDISSVDETATDEPLVVFASQAPFELEATPVDFVGEAPFVRINVGNSEKSFTAGTADGRSDFDADADLTVLSLGTLQLSLEEAGTFGGINVAGNVRKENGDDFDFQGGDDHTLTFSVGSGQLQEGAEVYLHTDVDCTNGDTFGTVNTISEDELTSFGIEVSGTTTQLTSEYHVCYSIDSDESIPEVGQIAATWNVDFFNARYDNIAEEAGDFGDLLRNGCIASFFNVPASGNADTAYIRLTNTSTTNEGDIRGTLYAQDGTVLGEDVTIAPDLAVHATQIFSTEGADRTTGADQEVLDIETAFGVDGADYKGRARLVLKGAFDTCEGQGLIRTGGGSLFNMTSTTQGNEAANPNDGNNGN